MKENTLGDYPNIPDALKKDKSITEQINADTSKRSGKFKVVRHRVKELLNKLIR